MGGKIVNFASQSAYNQYLADRGISNNGQIVNQAKYQKADFSKLQGYDPNQTDSIVKAFRQKEKIEPTDYGYTKNAVLDSRIKALGLNKNPDDVNYDITPGGLSARAGSALGKLGFTPDTGGGPKTPQSDGKSFGSRWITAKTGEKSAYQNDPFENISKTNEAKKFSNAYSSFSNSDYESGGAKADKPVISLGKAEKVFGKTSTKEYGYKDIGKNQLVRGSQQEETTKANEAARAAGGKKGVTMELSENLAVNDVISGNTTKSTSGANVLSDKDFRTLLTSEESKGAEFLFFSGSKEVGKSSGPRAYRDYLAAQKQYGSVVLQTTYPAQEKAIIESVKKNPSFFAKEPNSYWEGLGKSGVLTESGFKQVKSILHANWILETGPARAQDQKFRADLSIGSFYGQSWYIYDNKGNLVKTTSGSRSYHDILAAEKTYRADNIIVKPHESHPYGPFTFPKSYYEKASSNDASIRPNATPPYMAVPQALTSIFSTSIQQGITAVSKIKNDLPILYANIIRNKHESTSTGFLDVFHTIIPISVSKSVKESIKSGSLQVRGSSAPISEDVKSSFQSYTGPVLSKLGLVSPQLSRQSRQEISLGYLTSAGLITSGIKGFNPLSIKSIGKFATEEGKIVSNTFLATGSAHLGYKGLLGRTTSGWKFGGPTYERVRPEGSSFVVENPQRGTEIATPNRLAADFLTSKGYWEQVTKIGKASTPVEGKLVQYAKTMNKVLTNPETNIQRSNIIETNREGLSKTTVKGGLTGISEKQGVLNILDLRTGKAGKIQGSTSTEQFLPADILSKLKSVAPAHDIDVIKSNPLGLFEETQAQGLARYTNLAIQKEQGIAPEKGTVFRALPKAKLDKIVTGQLPISAIAPKSDIYTSPQASVAAFYGELHNARGMAKISLESESDILDYGSIPKSEMGINNPIDNWRKGNPVLIGIAKGKGAKGLKKPIKTGGEETILFGTDLITGVEKVPSSIKITQVLGRKIYEGKEKAIEFVTRKDETGSGLGKSGTVYGTAIDTKTFKSTVKGTNKNAKHTSGIFQAQTNLAKIGIQTKESAEAQGATPEQLDIIGTGEIFSPELFAEKAIIRPYYQTLATSRELLKNPATKKEALAGIEAAHAMRYYRFDNPETALFKWESKQNKSVDDYLNEQQTSTSTLSPTSRFAGTRLSLLYSSGNFDSKTPRSTTSNAESSIESSRVSTSSRSSKSVKSVLSAFSDVSSALLGSSPLLSGKSGKSGRSSTSAKSVIPYSAPSGKPRSSKSGTSSTPFNGSSGLSGSFSSLAAISSRTPGIGTTFGNTFRPNVKSFNFDKRRKYRTRGGPTAIRNLRVINPFASSLNIYPKRKYEF